MKQRTFNLLVGAAAAAIISAASILFVTSARADWNVSAMNQQIDQTNFLVNDNCSGTLIDAENGYVLTANHCVKDTFQEVERERVKENGEVERYKVKVSKPGTVSQFTYEGPNETSKTSFVYKVKDTDADHDIALLKVVVKLARIAAPVACVAPQRGEPVYAVGNPFAVLTSSVTKGIVANVHRDYRAIGIDGQGGDGEQQPGDNGLIQHSAPIEGGNSGGALYNDKGELVGVNVRSSPVNETVAFAVPLSDVRKFLADHGVTLPTCP